MAETNSGNKVELETKPQLSEIEELRKENERLRREKELLELEKQEVKRFVSARKKLSPAPAKFLAADIKEIIPAFNPENSDINSNQWLDILENYRNIYEWDDRNTMFYASFRLEKAARGWYLGRGAGIVRWSEFKDQFIETFPPNPTPPAQEIESQIEQPKSRKRRRRENCIQRANSNQCYRNCFLCKEPGHFARECTASVMDTNVPCYQMRIVKSNINRNDRGLIKNVTVDGVVIKAFIDLGSDCTTLKLHDSVHNHWYLEEIDAQLNGFGGTTVSVLGKFRRVVKVDEVARPIDIYVVPSNSQNYSLIVGRNFLNSPDVCVIKRFGSLEVKSV